MKYGTKVTVNDGFYDNKMGTIIQRSGSDIRHQNKARYVLFYKVRLSDGNHITDWISELNLQEVVA